MMCTSVRRLARQGYEFSGLSLLNSPALLSQFHHRQYKRERTGNCDQGRERRICTEVKRVVSPH